MKTYLMQWKESSLIDKFLYLYIALIPLLDLPVFVLFGKKIIAADFVFILMLLALGRRYLKKPFCLMQLPLRKPLLLMAGVFSLSVLKSGNLEPGIGEMLSLVYLIFLFFAVILILDDEKKIKFSLWVYFLTAFLISLWGLGIFSSALLCGDLKSTAFMGYGTMESMAHHFPRLDMTFASPNMLLAYLHVALIFAAALFVAEIRKKPRLFIGFAALPIFTAAFFTGSRRFTGLLLSLFILLCWYGKSRLAAVFKYLLLSGFIVFFCVSFLTSIWVIFPVDIKRNVNTHTVTLTVHDSYSVHYLLPVVALNMLKIHPLIGIGYGGFNKNFKDYVDWQWYRSEFGFEAYPGYLEEAENQTLNLDPHSLIFGTLAETGIAGFLALLYFLISYAFLLSKKTRTCLGFSKILSACVLAGFAGYILNSITLDALSMRHFWFMLGIGAAAGLSLNYAKK